MFNPLGVEADFADKDVRTPVGLKPIRHSSVRETASTRFVFPDWENRCISVTDRKGKGLDGKIVAEAESMDVQLMTSRPPLHLNVIIVPSPRSHCPVRYDILLGGLENHFSV